MRSTEAKGQIEGGPLVESDLDVWEEIAHELSNGKVDRAAGVQRRYLEYAARLLADPLGAAVDDGIPGTYRLNWTALRTTSGQLPSSHRMSGAFEIRQ